MTSNASKKHAIRRWTTGLLLAVAAAAAPGAIGEKTDHVLGPADPVAVDQPRVTIEVLDPVTLDSLGPEYSSQFLLDTGAQGIMAVGYAVTELEWMYYQTDGVFYELGIGGLSPYDLSAPYRFDFAGSDYQRITLGTDVRFLSNGNVDFGGFGGVLGMPAMVDRVTELYMPQMLGDPDDPLGFGFDYLGVYFSDGDPPAAAGSRYTVPVEVVAFPPPEQPDPGNPLPTYGPLPFIRAGAQHEGRESLGQFVLDTGAQVSMLSPEIAFALGLDADNDGDLNDDAIGLTEFQGAGGTVQVPLFYIEKFVLPTDQGVDLVWTDLELPVYFIDEAIGGIFGSDLLTTGWFRAVFDTRDTGAFEKVWLDFRNADSGNGTMILDTAATYDQQYFLIYPNGDANRDGAVDIQDFVILKQNYGSTDAAWADGDFTGEGDVDIQDFTILKQNYGRGM